MGWGSRIRSRYLYKHKPVFLLNKCHGFFAILSFVLGQECDCQFRLVLVFLKIHKNMYKQ